MTWEPLTTIKMTRNLVDINRIEGELSCQKQLLTGVHDEFAVETRTSILLFEKYDGALHFYGKIRDLTTYVKAFKIMPHKDPKQRQLVDVSDLFLEDYLKERPESIKPIAPTLGQRLRQIIFS